MIPQAPIGKQKKKRIRTGRRTCLFSRRKLFQRGEQQMQMQTEGFGCWPFRFGWKGTAVFSRARIPTFVPALSFHMTKTKRIACSGQSEDGKNLIWYLHYRRCCRRKRRHYVIQIRSHGVAARVAQNTWWVGSKGTSDVGVLGKLHVVALVLGGQIAVHVNWPRDLTRLVGTQPHVATTCYKTSTVSSRRSTRKEALSYFENCWAGWLCFLSRTLKRSTQMMAQFPQLGGLLRLKCSTWHLGLEPRPRLLITNTNQEQTHTTRKPYNKRFTRLKKMKLNLTRKPNNNKRLTHVQLKQIKTQSKNLLITTKPNKNDPNTSNRWKPEEKTQFSSKRTSRRWSRTGEASFTSWNGSVRRVTIRVLDCSLDNDHDYRKRPCSQSLTSLQMVQASWKFHGKGIKWKTFPKHRKK